jgi:N-acetylneuraminic acid mutarotase
MNRRLWLGPLTLCSLVVSCGRDAAPTEPAVAAENPSTITSLAVAGGTWTTKAPMPTPRAYLAAGVQNNSLGQPVLYAIGGIDPGAGPVRTVEAYNFATNTWSTRARLPFALTSTNGVGVIGGRLYMSGGFFHSADGRSGYHPGLNVYDPARNTWTKKADMPRRFAQGITGVIGGKLYVLVGSCNNCGTHERISSRLYRYDPVTNTWVFRSRGPHAHASGAGAVINGKFYVAGGTGADNRPSSQLDVYDPATNRWTALAPMPEARTGMAGASLQNKLYIIGKSNADPGERQGQVDAYDPVTNTWSSKTPIPGAGRGDLAAARVTYQGRSHILAVGGFDVEGSTPGDVNQAYTP